MIGINTSALMMLLRIYAMYEKNIKVVVLVAATFTVELGMNAWLLTKGIGVYLLLTKPIDAPFDECYPPLLLSCSTMSSTILRYVRQRLKTQSVLH